ncbi:molybdopterin-binding protein [Leptospira sp. severe_002]|uniref:molybdopterin-binding protein n=1 Tax=Leptospira sp. severe_002 TaxID=2838237 RepID=UPI001E356DB8|nr:molybdopterin-binding protein [Leptospira sp. severe_002]
MAAEIENQRIAKLTPLNEVVQSFDTSVEPVAPREEDIGTALGKTLAADMGVSEAWPAAAIALRDGFAVSADQTTDASSYAPAPLSPAPVRVDAGDPLPAQADAVAPLDAVNAQGAALASVAPGEGVLPAGADAAPGVVRLTGGRLRKIDVATLTALGVKRVMIREPRVHVVATGKSDVIAAATGLIANAIDSDGGFSIRTDNLETSLKDGSTDCVVAIGGTGQGRNDNSVNTLARIGKILFHGIGITPGETTAFGFVGKRPVLLLPGRVDTALAGWLTVGRRMLARLCFRLMEEQPFPAELGRKIASPLGLAEVVPIRRRAGLVEPLASGYLPMQALARSEGWILIPADSEGHPQGARVIVRPWP